MLSRRSSTVSTSPRRSKSALSLRVRPLSDEFAGFENEDVAHSNAITAAERAFKHSSRGSVMTMEETDDIEGNASVARAQQPHCFRQKSIRFAGPLATPSSNQSVRRRTVSNFHTQSGAQHALFSLDNHSSEVGPLKDFESSSSKKLNRARSMSILRQMDPDKATDNVSAAGKHLRRRSVRSFESLGKVFRPSDVQGPKPVALLLDVVNRIGSASRRYETHDEAFRLAQNEYRCQAEQQRLKSQPSIFNFAKWGKVDQAFRHTVRSSSLGRSEGNRRSDVNDEEIEKPKKLSSKARVFSHSVRMRIKYMFRRKANGGARVPIQHLQASRAHFQPERVAFGDTRLNPPPVPSPDAELLRRVGSRETLVYTPSLNPTSDSRQGSLTLDSSKEDLNMEKSRVSSWTDSIAPNTVQMSNQLERKRLSVIREDGGPHQPSSSTEPSLEGVNDAPFQQPLKRGKGAVALEPQRIFSALRKEFARKNPSPELSDGNSEIDSTSELVRGVQSQGPLESVQRTRNFEQAPSHMDYLEVNQTENSQQIYNSDEGRLNSHRGPFYEMGLSLFPETRRVEQQRGTSPYRKLKQSQAVDRAVQSSMHLGSRFESIYSDTIKEENKTAMVSSSANAEYQEEGTTMLLPAQSRRYSMSTSPYRGHRHESLSSTKSSIDWKSKLASEMSYFDHLAPVEHHIDHGQASHLRHVRENAQTGTSPIDKMHLISDRPLSQVWNMPRTRSEDPMPFSHNQAKHPVLERFPVRSAISPAGPAISLDKENTPPPTSLHREIDTSDARISTHPLPVHGRISVQRKSSPLSLAPRNVNTKASYGSLHRSSLDHAHRVERLQGESSALFLKASSKPHIEATFGCMSEVKTSPVSRELSENFRSQQISPKKQPGNGERPASIQRDKSQLVHSILRDRRKINPISEESAGDTAFL